MLFQVAEVQSLWKVGTHCQDVQSKGVRERNTETRYPEHSKVDDLRGRLVTVLDTWSRTS